MIMTLYILVALVIVKISKFEYKEESYEIKGVLLVLKVKYNRIKLVEK